MDFAGKTVATSNYVSHGRAHSGGARKAEDAFFALVCGAAFSAILLVATQDALAADRNCKREVCSAAAPTTVRPDSAALAAAAFANISSALATMANGPESAMEGDVSRRERRRECRAMADGLSGDERREFVRNCMDE